MPFTRCTFFLWHTAEGGERPVHRQPSPGVLKTNGGAPHHRGAAVLSIPFPPPYGGGGEALGKRLLIRGARPIGNLQVSAVPIQEGVVHLAFLHRPGGEVVGGVIIRASAFL